MMATRKKRVLFVCIHNSGRSQMAESFLNSIAPDKFEAFSAGIEPGSINPVVAQVMAEAGFDISSNRTKSVKSFLDKGSRFDFVVTVCDEATAERCPIFPGGKKIHMGFSDPSSFKGKYEEKLERTRKLRDIIKRSVEQFVLDCGD